MPSPQWPPDGAYTYSADGAFTTADDVVAPPVALAPRTGLAPADPQATFAWTAVGGATAYEVEAAPSGDFSGPTQTVRVPLDRLLSEADTDALIADASRFPQALVPCLSEVDPAACVLVRPTPDDPRLVATGALVVTDTTENLALAKHIRSSGRVRIAHTGSASDLRLVNVRHVRLDLRPGHEEDAGLGGLRRRGQHEDAPAALGVDDDG